MDTEIKSIPVTNLGEFIQTFTKWHEDNLAVLEHMMKIPEGTQVQVNDGQMILLDKQTLMGFQTGLITALAQFSRFPFESDDDEPSILDDSPSSHAH